MIWIRSHLAALWYRLTKDPDPYPPEAAEVDEVYLSTGVPDDSWKSRPYAVPGPTSFDRAQFNARFMKLAAMELHDLDRLMALFAVEVDR